MYYDTAPVARFDKPAKDAVIDLINKHNSTFFEYGELTLVSLTVLPPAPEAVKWTAANTQVTVRQSTSDDGPTAKLNYHRLDWTRYMGPGPHYLPATVPTAAELALTYLDQQKNILVAPEEVTINVDTEVQPDGSFEITITPVADNPVWVGQLKLNGVGSNHIGTHFSRFWFSKLKLADLQVLEPI